MNVADDLATGFARNTGYLARIIEPIDHATSLAQHGQANCLNWTVGHIVHYRNTILALVEAPKIEWDDLRYERESDPITEDGPGVVDFGELKRLLAESGEALKRAVGGCTDAALSAEVMVGEKSVAIGSRVQFFFFHDTLHVGQADVLAAIG